MTDFEELRTWLASFYHAPKDMMFGSNISNHDDKELEVYYSMVKKILDGLTFDGCKKYHWVKNGSKKYKQTIKIKKRKFK